MAYNPRTLGPTIALLRKTMVRGRGPHRIRAIISVTFGAAAHAGGYTNGKGFCDDPGALPNNGIDIQSILDEAIMLPSAVGDGFVGSIVDPRMVTLANFTGFTTNFLGAFGMLDFDHMDISNYVTGGGTVPPYKMMFVRIYGLKAGPVFDEASTDAAITGGTFIVELEYTPISGAEA